MMRIGSSARKFFCTYAPPTCATWRPNCMPICAVASFIMLPAWNDGMPVPPAKLSHALALCPGDSGT